MKNQIPQFLNSSILESLDSSSQFNPIVQLDDQTAYCVLFMSAFMNRSGKIQGAEQHRWFDLLLDSGIRTGSDLRPWMHESFPALNARGWDTCQKQADRFLETGVNVFRRVAGRPSGSRVGESRVAGGLLTHDPKPMTRDPCAPCPTVLFGKGRLKPDFPLLAVFNSRKPRLVSPDSSWLRALRLFFHGLDPPEIALAASTGTLTYELAGVLALRSGMPQILIAPFPLMAADPELLKIYGEDASGIPVLSCMLDTVTCSRKHALICRDRIIAGLANLHLVLEIRSRGNLLAVLEEIQAKSPRPQVVFNPEKRNPSNAGNYTLLTKFSEHAHGFKLPSVSRGDGEERSFSREVAKPRRNEEQRAAILIPWDDYLFHYTRACAGPWPGETYRQYLLELLDAQPLSGHSALDTLIRMMKEGLIRAGSRMVRGKAEVISWSSHPPQELFLMQKWNRTLARWTVEPYGFAVRRDILRSQGAKPVIYGSEEIFSRLAESERYRFQLSRSEPSASWRHEREWRFQGDLGLDKIHVTGHGCRVTSQKTTCDARLGDSQLGSPGFVFVQTEEEKAKLYGHVNSKLPVVVLGG